MTSDRTILITGVTGNQGGAVAKALQGAGFHLRGLTRLPGTRVRPRAHEASRLGTPPRATNWELKRENHGRPYATRCEFRAVPAADRNGMF
jgi:nucleoside-diphosphate-sugar epimerase